MIRECREELAITLDVGEKFMDVIHEYPDLTVHLTLFHATIRKGIPQKLEHTFDQLEQFILSHREGRALPLSCGARGLKVRNIMQDGAALSKM